MTGQRCLKLCIFCAFRQLPRRSRCASTRTFTTTTSRSQESDSKAPSNQDIGSSWAKGVSFDASILTAAEQAERAHLHQLRARQGDVHHPARTRETLTGAQQKAQVSLPRRQQTASSAGPASSRVQRQKNIIRRIQITADPKTSPSESTNSSEPPSNNLNIRNATSTLASRSPNKSTKREKPTTSVQRPPTTPQLRIVPTFSTGTTSPSQEPSNTGWGTSDSQSWDIKDDITIELPKEETESNDEAKQEPLQDMEESKVESEGANRNATPAHNQEPRIRFDYGSDRSRAYQTRSFEQQEQRESTAGFNAASWRHLRRKSQGDDVFVRPEDDDASPPNKSQVDDDAWVERTFLQHQQQRPLSQRQFSASNFNPNIRESNNVSKTASDRRCARCGEVGHIARQCQQPPQIFRRTSSNPAQSASGRESRGMPDAIDTRRNRTEQAADSATKAPKFDHYTPFPTVSSSSGRDSRADDVNEGSIPTEKSQGDLPLKSPVSSGQKGSAALVTETAGSERTKARERRMSMFVTQDEDDGVSDSKDHARKTRDDDRKRGRPARRGRDEEDDDDLDESLALRDERVARKMERKAQRELQLAARQAEQKAQHTANGVPVRLPEFVSVATLAQTLGVRYEAFVARLSRLGYDDIFPGKVFNSEISGMIAMEYNFDPSFEDAAPTGFQDLQAEPEIDDKSFLPARPPVVTIMGHVDHGKTTILDYLRKSSVAAGEAGGITQHIGAFSVALASSGKSITFLDTPGHAAFLAMRQRGANVTDIVVLVVAADDSVKPQTIEAIKHAKGAGVPIIVAVNKIDKPEADLQRVKQDVARHGVDIEDFGGETQVVAVSGKTGQGMDELEENIATLSEILDHRAQTDGTVEGWVLEATTKKSGRVATVLVRRGTLKIGTILVAGRTWTRVRTLRNEGGIEVSEVGPGMPVEVDGWRDQPVAGDEVLQAPSEQRASDVVDYRIEREERAKAAADVTAINENRRIEQEKREKERLLEEPNATSSDSSPQAPTTGDRQGGPTMVPFIIKADVSGSVEAVSSYIMSISHPMVAPQILSSAVGGVHESDIELANAASGYIIAFNLPTDEGMKAQAEARGVKILENNIIYRTLDDVKEILQDKLPPIITHRVLGEAEISAVFDIGIGGRRKMKIAGCKVRNGQVNRGSRVRVQRGASKVYDGVISSLKNVKKDVQEMRKGTECGMGFENWEVFEVGDTLQTYEEIIEKRKL